MPVSTSINPTIITGIEEIKILKKIILLLKKLTMSLLKYTNTAIKEPMCKLTSIERL